MSTAALPPQTEHLPGFVPDADTLYWRLLEEFYAHAPSHVDFGGSRMLAGSFSSDELSPLTEFAGIEKSSQLRKAFFLPITAMVAGMVYRHTGVMPQMCSMNLYRNGDDFIAPHADTDLFLGPDPENVVVASVSFGASRLLKLERMDRKDECNVVLQSGDLFVMKGTFQREWLHSIPEGDATSPRLSLNFVVPRKEDAEDRATWLLAEVPEAMLDLVTKSFTRSQLSRKLRTRQGPIPRPVYCGSMEEVFTHWTALEKEGADGLVAVAPGQRSVFETREGLLQAEQETLEPLLPEGDPLRLIKDYVAAPNPDSIDLTILPAPFLEDMSNRIEAELNGRVNIE